MLEQIQILPSPEILAATDEPSAAKPTAGSLLFDLVMRPAQLLNSRRTSESSCHKDAPLRVFLTSLTR